MNTNSFKRLATGTVASLALSTVLAAGGPAAASARPTAAASAHQPTAAPRVTFAASAASASPSIISSHTLAPPKVNLALEVRAARPLTPSVSAGAAGAAARALAARSSGPARHIAGALGSLDKSAQTDGHPLLGPAGTPWPGNQQLPPATTSGKVEFQDHDGNGYVCSGSLVNSAGKDLVITAGHCVFGAGGGTIPGETWHQNWAFAPDYNNGVAPYGWWSAKQLFTPTAYMTSPNQTDEQDDIGAAILNTNSAGQHAVDLLGGEGISWNQNNSQSILDLGYPAGAPFNGATLEECDGTDFYSNQIAMELLPCNFTGGSSGGPWLTGFDGEWGYVNGVNDATYSSYPSDMASLYFGNNVRALYDATQNL